MSRKQAKRSIEGSYIFLRNFGYSKQQATEFLMIQRDLRLALLGKIESSLTDRVFDFYNMFNNPNPVPPWNQNQKRLLKSSLKDPDLRAYVKREFEETESYNNITSFNIDVWKRILEGESVEQLQVPEELNKGVYSKNIDIDSQTMIEEEEEKYSLLNQYVNRCNYISKKKKEMEHKLQELESEENTEESKKEELQTLKMNAKNLMTNIKETRKLREKLLKIFEADKPPEDWQVSKQLVLQMLASNPKEKK